jgi:hypothetical protein
MAPVLCTSNCCGLTRRTKWAKTFCSHLNGGHFGADSICDWSRDSDCTCVSHCRGSHKVGIAFLSGSNASIFDLVQLLHFHPLPKDLTMQQLLLALRSQTSEVKNRFKKIILEDILELLEVYNSHEWKHCVKNLCYKVKQFIWMSLTNLQENWAWSCLDCVLWILNCNDSDAIFVWCGQNHRLKVVTQVLAFVKALKSCKLCAPQFHIFAQVKMSRLCANNLCWLNEIGKSGQCKMTQMFPSFSQ